MNIKVHARRFVQVGLESTKIGHNFLENNNHDLHQMHKWFYVQLAQKILNGN
jgi:hypothetical protein